jgi:hypothetical protein
MTTIRVKENRRWCGTAPLQAHHRKLGLLTDLQPASSTKAHRRAQAQEAAVKRHFKRIRVNAVACACTEHRVDRDGADTP